jgi:mRNA interferase YafQ
MSAAMKKSEVKQYLTDGNNYLYEIDVTNQFKKDFVLCESQHLNVDLVCDAVRILAADGKLPANYKPHKLSGNFSNVWECHIKSDWVMTWLQNDTELTLLFLSTGSHTYVLGM